ncbi:hypothetical protein C8J56DRAFT_1038158 [Mycena floridula]|nr:hypothetical protein C8J56DRAFT_1038158 [Mycena floridula]
MLSPFKFSKALVLAIVALDATLAQAALYVSCNLFSTVEVSLLYLGRRAILLVLHVPVEWLDDGQRPLLSAVGVSYVGLYTGKQKLVQTITPVDVSASLSLTFVPNPEAGPNSDTYYIGFTSVAKINGSSTLNFSPFFKLDQMSGSFASPLAAATSSIPIPSAIEQATSIKPTGIKTITVGTLHTSLPSLTFLSSTRVASSSATPTTTISINSSPSSSASSTSASSSAPTNSAASSQSTSSAVSQALLPQSIGLGFLALSCSIHPFLPLYLSLAFYHLRNPKTILEPWGKKRFLFACLVDRGTDFSLARQDSKPDFPPAETTIVESTCAPHRTGRRQFISAETL